MLPMFYVQRVKMFIDPIVMVHISQFIYRQTIRWPGRQMPAIRLMFCTQATRFHFESRIRHGYRAVVIIFCSVVEQLVEPLSAGLKVHLLQVPFVHILDGLLTSFWIDPTFWRFNIWNSAASSTTMNTTTPPTTHAVTTRPVLTTTANTLVSSASGYLQWSLFELVKINLIVYFPSDDNHRYYCHHSKCIISDNHIGHNNINNKR